MEIEINKYTVSYLLTSIFIALLGSRMNINESPQDIQVLFFLVILIPVVCLICKFVWDNE